MLYVGERKNVNIFIEHDRLGWGAGGDWAEAAGLRGRQTQDVPVWPGGRWLRPSPPRSTLELLYA